MSPSTLDEDWLDVATLSTGGSDNSTLSGLPFRAAPDSASVPEGRLPELCNPKATHTETESLYRSMRENAEKLLTSGSSVFHVDVGGDRHVLHDAFVNGLPPKYRQEFNCSSCRQFMKRFGDLAMVDAKTGNLVPLFWNSDSQEEFYQKPVKAIANLFQASKVRTAFQVTEKTINAGAFESGGFHHMNFTFPTQRLRPAEPKGFASATCVELAEMLDRILEDNQISTIHTAADFLLEDTLSYAEKHKHAIRWLKDLVDNGRLMKESDHVNRHNLLYLAAADSFLGCIHQLRSGAISTLLEDIEQGLPFATIRSNWEAVADPLAYMRPTADPSAGNVAAAEKLFSELGLSKDDLKRKYLLMKDVPQEVLMWKSATVPQQPSGIFSDLIPKPKPPPSVTATEDDPSIPPTSLTFASFINRVVPTAKTIEYHLTSHPSLHFLVTGLPNTNPLMQWHTSTNLVSHYVYYNSKPANEHNLFPGWTPLTAIIPFAHLWEGIPATTTLPLSDELTQPPHKPTEGKGYKHAQHGFNYLLCLADIEDESDSSCLFPSFLRRELHGIRSTIEAYSDKQRIVRVEGEGPMVGGIAVRLSEATAGKMQHLLRVTDAGGRVRRYRVTLFQ